MIILTAGPILLVSEGYYSLKKIILCVAVFSLFLSVFPFGHGFAAVQSEPIVKVKLINFLGNKSEITLKPNGDYQTNDPNILLKSGSTYLIKLENEKIALYKDNNLLNSYDSFSASPIQASSQLSINSRLYLGNFDFMIENKKYIRPINSVSMENYLKGVVPIEMYPFWNIEALKTQAVAARTYAMSYITRGLIDDTILYQVYGGYIWTPNTTRAVDETKGQVAQYNGRLIDAVYSASNGGRTESNANAWGTTAVPYLPIKQDPYDPKTSWKFAFHQTQIDITSLDLTKPSEWWSSTIELDPTISSNIKLWLTNNGYANKEIKIISIPEFSLHNVGSGQRVSKGNIAVEFFVKDKVDELGNLITQRMSFSNVSISKVRSIIGNRMMLSYLVNEVKSENGMVTVSGTGDGHGVGMSQWGAQNMAGAGKNYQEILKFYYPGIAVTQMYEGNTQAIATEPGWLKEQDKWYYIQSNGTKATGWIKDASKWYYLGTNGVMLTGWQKVNGKWYFLNSNGAMATGWIKSNNKWYYLYSSGAMATGWITDRGKKYYLSSSGAMVQNKQYINGKWYTFHSSGYLL
ncbi:SpoIID/LytB domain protein [Bacillus sp. SLBN-46]|uniref:SpoIID/LytB domain-containing protein n=1 Tax=Bacillus sp. SLBN-46 TaxID=3042283 RepID=UPI0028548CB7|nr:SpoIID/LytB domain-containing protein [Bacillus sp. SLBN-46]MDR6123394.1 SpoIID/LytB domain protein [Bacillus sp. SLBN-46]